MSYHGSDNDSPYGKNENMGILMTCPFMPLKPLERSKYLLKPGRMVFHIARTMVHFLKVNGIFVCLAHDDPQVCYTIEFFQLIIIFLVFTYFNLVLPIFYLQLVNFSLSTF